MIFEAHSAILPCSAACNGALAEITGSFILHHCRLKSLWVLDIDGLHVAVKFLLCSLFIVASPRYPHSQSKRYPFDPGFPHLFVQLRVQSHVRRTLSGSQSCQVSILPLSIAPRNTLSTRRRKLLSKYHGSLCKFANFFYSTGRSLFELKTEDLRSAMSSDSAACS